MLNLRFLGVRLRSKALRLYERHLMLQQQLNCNKKLDAAGKDAAKNPQPKSKNKLTEEKQTGGANSDIADGQSNNMQALEMPKISTELALYTPPPTVLLSMERQVTEAIAAAAALEEGAAVADKQQQTDEAMAKMQMTAAEPQTGLYIKGNSVLKGASLRYDTTKSLNKPINARAACPRYGDEKDAALPAADKAAGAGAAAAIRLDERLTGAYVPKPQSAAAAFAGKAAARYAADKSSAVNFQAAAASEDEKYMLSQVKAASARLEQARNNKSGKSNAPPPFQLEAELQTGGTAVDDAAAKPNTNAVANAAQAKPAKPAAAEQLNKSQNESIKESAQKPIMRTQRLNSKIGKPRYDHTMPDDSCCDFDDAAAAADNDEKQLLAEKPPACVQCDRSAALPIVAASKQPAKMSDVAEGMKKAAAFKATAATQRAAAAEKLDEINAAAPQKLRLAVDASCRASPKARAAERNQPVQDDAQNAEPSVPSLMYGYRKTIDKLKSSRYAFKRAPVKVFEKEQTEKCLNFQQAYEKMMERKESNPDEVGFQVNKQLIGDDWRQYADLGHDSNKRIEHRYASKYNNKKKHEDDNNN